MYQQRSCRGHSEAAASELREVRTKLMKSRKDVHRLENFLEKTIGDASNSNSKSRADKNPSVGAFLDAIGGKAPLKERRPSSGMLSSEDQADELDRAGKSRKRPAPTGLTGIGDSKREPLAGGGWKGIARFVYGS